MSWIKPSGVVKYYQIDIKGTNPQSRNISDGKTNFTFSNLTEYTLYEISIQAGNDIGLGEEATINATTLPSCKFKML